MAMAMRKVIGNKKGSRIRKWEVLYQERKLKTTANLRSRASNTPTDLLRHVQCLIDEQELVFEAMAAQ